MKLLSKSDYMLFLKHPAWLWIKKNNPKLIPPVDENTQAKFDAGHKFEPYAESLFPEGLALGFTDYNEYLSLPERTQVAISNGEPVLFQPRFEWSGFTCICDILQFTGENEVDLYEVKASTSAKAEHEYDLAFQTAVLEGTGLKVRNIYVIHVNNKYKRDGDIDAEKITHIQEVTDKVRAKGEATAKYMHLALKVAQQKEMPDPSPALAKLNSKNDWSLIYENIVPSEKKVWAEDTKPTLDTANIRGFLGELVYPLYFLDYETLMSLIPYFDGQRPYQQVPFQYSIHVLRSPEAEPEWYEYLHRDNSNPVRPLTEKLLEDLGTSGTILVWYEKFEKARNTELGEMLPEYEDALEAINARIVDLIIPFKNKWYDDPRCEGSASIKAVLPVLCPKLSYKELGIQEGGSAQRLWMEAVLDSKRAEQKDQILEDLIEYCKLDTYAMVEIYRCLKEV
jgi:hypothetical protein